MSLIVIKTSGTFTAGSQATYSVMLAKLIKMWGESVRAHFSIRLITESQIYGQEEGAFFQKGAHQRAYLDEEKRFCLDPEEPPATGTSTVNIPGITDVSMELATIKLLCVAIQQTAATLPKENQTQARALIEEVFKAL